MASIYKRGGSGSYIVSWYDASGRRRTKSTRTTDRKVAERIAAKLDGDVALRREGVVDARQDRFGQENRRPLRDHIEDYLEHCRHIALAPQHVASKARHLGALSDQGDASRLSELTADVLERSLRGLRNKGLSARTVNFRRQTAVAFMNWCVEVGRVDSNPLTVVKKLDETRDRRRIRRALTDDELGRLLVAADLRGRKAWYLTAAFAGLRRSELLALTWGDLDLKQGTLTVRQGKAHRVDIVPLHPELAEELRRVRPALALPTARVFPTGVTDRTRKGDFRRAEIELVDESGRVADLHSLRTTLGTRLARQGVTPQVGQRIMRHADYRTTLKHYTVLGLADTSQAMSALPPITPVLGAQRATGTLGAGAANKQQHPQQNRQHSGRVPVRDAAIGFDVGSQGSASSDATKGPVSRPSRDTLRSSAPQHKWSG